MILSVKVAGDKGLKSGRFSSGGFICDVMEVQLGKTVYLILICLLWEYMTSPPYKVIKAII